MAKIHRFTRKKLHRLRVLLEREKAAELKAQRRAEKDLEQSARFYDSSMAGCRESWEPKVIIQGDRIWTPTDGWSTYTGNQPAHHWHVEVPQ